MALIMKDRVKETSTTTGTGTLALGGAVTNFKAFSAVLANDDTTVYAIVHRSAAEWEVGIGTWTTGNNLARTTIIASSNSDSVVSLSAGTKDVYITLSADSLIHLLAYSTTTTPGVPATGVNLFSRTIASRAMAAMIGPSGLDTALQPLVGRNKVQWADPVANTTTVNTMGATVTATGTGTAHACASTNMYTSLAKVEYLVTTPATTAVAGFRVSQNSLWRGNAAGLGGFHVIIRAGQATGVASVSTERFFIGISTNTGAPTDVQPSSLVNCIGVGYDAADTNYHIMHNDGSGTCTKVDTSIAQPTADRTDVCELALFAAPNGSDIKYQFTLLNTGSTFSGTISTDMPSNTTFLSARGYHSVGGTSSVTGLGLFGFYTETDL